MLRNQSCAAQQEALKCHKRESPNSSPAAIKRCVCRCRERLRTGGFRWRSEPAFGVARRTDPPAALSSVGDSRFERHTPSSGTPRLTSSVDSESADQFVSREGHPFLNKGGHRALPPLSVALAGEQEHPQTFACIAENSAAGTRIALMLTNWAIHLEANGFGSPPWTPPATRTSRIL